MTAVNQYEFLANGYSDILEKIKVSLKIDAPENVTELPEVIARIVEDNNISRFQARALNEKLMTEKCSSHHHTHSEWNLIKENSELRDLAESKSATARQLFTEKQDLAANLKATQKDVKSLEGRLKIARADVDYWKRERDEFGRTVQLLKNELGAIKSNIPHSAEWNERIQSGLEENSKLRTKINLYQEWNEKDGELIRKNDDLKRILAEVNLDLTRQMDKRVKAGKELDKTNDELNSLKTKVASYGFARDELEKAIYGE